MAPASMGEVWRATDEALGRVVAAKVMLPSLLEEPGFAERFRAEARAMASSTSGQFFIGYEDSDIPPDYTVIGAVSSGLEIVEEVAAAGHDDAYADLGGGGVPNRELVIETLRISG